MSDIYYSYLTCGQYLTLSFTPTAAFPNKWIEWNKCLIISNTFEIQNHCLLPEKQDWQTLRGNYSNDICKLAKKSVRLHSAARLWSMSLLFMKRVCPCSVYTVIEQNNQLSSKLVIRKTYNAEVLYNVKIPWCTVPFKIYQTMWTCVV